MPIDILTVTQDQIKRVTSKGEGHFLDLKAKQILPGKLTKTLSAFANADGGELVIGFDETKKGQFVWNGFDRIEDANGHVQVFEEFFPNYHVDTTMATCSLSAALAVDPAGGAGAPGVGIEISPAMIEAGIGEMVPFETLFDEPREGVARIFRAMIKASRQG